MKLRSVMMPVIRMGLASLILAMGCISCSTIFTDQSDCPRGVSLRFVYDYNMEYANAFPSKVHCLSVYVFDENGRFVERYDETSDVLRDESYRMEMNLDEGTYTLLAYGGLACPEKSFDITPYTRASEHIDDMRVNLKHDGFNSDKALHGLFYGAEQITVSHVQDFVQDTVYMLKNTNNIRVVLQQANGKSLSSDEFTFEITDDNSCMDKTNSVVPKGDVTYLPWSKGESVVGNAADGETPVSVAYAEFSTSRLTTGTSPKLMIRSAETGDDVINIPLNNYLLLLKSNLYSEMGAQEFLDRESEWSLIFFLDDGLRWINTRIVINDWVVRVNHAEM